MSTEQTNNSNAIDQEPSADPKLAALAKHLDVSTEDISLDRWGNYCLGDQEYRVLTDTEADEAATEDAKSTIWAFNASFLSGYCPALRDPRVEKAIKKLQEELCEDAGPIIEALLGSNLERALQDTISCDGRGHFLSSYDGHEHEVDGFCIYRVN